MTGIADIRVHSWLELLNYCGPSRIAFSFQRCLKADDWPSSEVDLEAIDTPKTSVATAIEVQYVMEDCWDRNELSEAHRTIAAEGIKFVPLSVEMMDAAGRLRRQYDSLNVFDAVHLGTERTLDEPIVSTDTLYPNAVEVDHVDPRDLE
ncbi:PIN domain-containing protein [Natronococcus roseus]|uniref:PIN domain-containing protein n=1 Tax=Natronococcus roseus TaxID=1052014 RepID=UPI00374CB489